MNAAWSGGHRDLGDAREPEERAARQRPRHQPGDQAGRLAVGVGLPGVQRSESHLGAVADQQEDERGRAAAPGCRRPRPAIRSSSMSGRPEVCAAARKKVPSSASAMPTEESTRYFQTASSERRSCRWNTSGASARVVASMPTQTSARWWLSGHQRGRGEEREQAADEHPAAARGLGRQEADRVDRDREEHQADQRSAPGGPARRPRASRRAPARPDRARGSPPRQVQRRGPDQQAETRARGRTR